MKILYIIRGLPGSGKSTYAQALSKRLGIPFYEADMWFLNRDGEYLYDRSKIGKAHEWCQSKVYEIVQDGDSVIVSNTFTTWKEIEPYVDMAAEYDFLVKIIQANGKWKNVHNVPETTIAKMQARFVDNKLLPQLDIIEYSEVY